MLGTASGETGRGLDYDGAISCPQICDQEGLWQTVDGYQSRSRIDWLPVIVPGHHPEQSPGLWAILMKEVTPDDSSSSESGDESRLPELEAQIISLSLEIDCRWILSCESWIIEPLECIGMIMQQLQSLDTLGNSLKKMYKKIHCHKSYIPAKHQCPVSMIHTNE